MGSSVHGVDFYAESKECLRHIDHRRRGTLPACTADARANEPAREKCSTSAPRSTCEIAGSLNVIFSASTAFLEYIPTGCKV
jgi:hypothetical protein